MSVLGCRKNKVGQEGGLRRKTRNLKGSIDVTESKVLFVWDYKLQLKLTCGIIWIEKNYNIEEYEYI